MPARRAAALALLLPLSLSLSLLGWSVPTAAEEPSAPDAVAEQTNVSVRVTSRQRVRLEALPQIVQHGGKVARRRRGSVGDHRAPSGRCGWGARSGCRCSRGRSGACVATARQDGRGRAQFASAASLGDGEPATYRVKLKAWGGLAAADERPGQHRAVADSRRGPTSSPAPSCGRCGTTAAASTCTPTAARARRATRGPRASGEGRCGSASSRTRMPRRRAGSAAVTRCPGATPTASTDTSARRASSASATASRRRG